MKNLKNRGFDLFEDGPRLIISLLAIVFLTTLVISYFEFSSLIVSDDLSGIFSILLTIVGTIFFALMCTAAFSVILSMVIFAGFWFYHKIADTKWFMKIYNWYTVRSLKKRGYHVI